MTNIPGDAQTAGRGRFSWSLALAGAASALAVIAALHLLGSSVGLSLAVSLREPEARPFFTGAAVYYFATLAFGFAVGGYISGRLLGARLETRLEEEVRAGTHGFVSWAIATLAVSAAIPMPIRLQELLGASAAAGVSTHIDFWVAVSLIFGAIIATFAAIFARLEDDREDAAETVSVRAAREGAQ